MSSSALILTYVCIHLFRQADGNYFLSRVYTGGELLRSDSQAGDAVLKLLWHHSDAILCCSVKSNVIL